MDACLARLAISNPTIHRPKVDIVNLAKQVAAHMPIFADLPDAQNNRPCLTLAILDYMREKGVATENDHVYVFAHMEYFSVLFCVEYFSNKVGSLFFFFRY